MGLQGPASDAGEWQFVGPTGIGLLRARYVRQSFPRHFHDCFVVCVNERGAHASWYAGGTVTIPEGAITVVPPGAVHTGHCIAGHPWYYRALYPSAATLVELSAAVGMPSNDIPVFPGLVLHDPELAERFVRVHRCCDADADPLERDAAVSELLMTLLERHAVRAKSAVGQLSPPGCVQRAVDYIHENAGRHITLDAMADASGVSRYAMLRAFRRSLGMPPYALVTQIRVERAKHLLMSGQPIAMAAFSAGFADQSHMTRQFKRLLGVTPGAFAKAPRQTGR
jgi:AraC-like DNA-binding protein